MGLRLKSGHHNFLDEARGRGGLLVTVASALKGA